ncbi:MAG: hypothetical protein SNJ71_06595 [Bacteroidales bacterium]
MKKGLFLGVLLGLSMAMFAGGEVLNDSRIEKVDYVGAFGTIDWTKGWANWDPINTDYPTPTVTKGNRNWDIENGVKITTNETWSGTILLDGWVFVKEGATLTIEPGTIIRGTAKSCLVIERGAKIMAVGTVDKPIVFTSSNNKGSRQPSDWAGLVICGNGVSNKGEGDVEGMAGMKWGRPVGHEKASNTESSGELKYVRLEFCGFDVSGGNGQEINTLTFYGVGSGTKVEYVQASYGGDDAFEFFGGAVNCKYLIAYSGEDDDFDTDNGWSGSVQFGLVVRDPKICDSDKARAFESDNDASGSDNKPYTNGIFSNITAVGPFKSNDADPNVAALHDAAVYMRRNTRIQIWNSVFAGFREGIILDGDKTAASAKGNEQKDTVAQIRYCILAGIQNKTAPVKTASTSKVTWSADECKTWFTGNNGSIFDDIFEPDYKSAISNPKNPEYYLYNPQTTPNLRNKSCWANAHLSGKVLEFNNEFPRLLNTNTSKFTDAQKAEFNKAIAEAETVIKKSGLTESEAETALNTLKAKIEDIKNPKINVDELSSATLVYPNPSTGVIYVAAPAKVYTLQGQLVAEGENQISLKKGTYAVVVNGISTIVEVK